MSKITIGEVVSRIRNHIKAVNQDAFLTDRYLYSIVIKHSAWLMKREDSQNKIMRFNSVMDTLDKVDLIEVDRSAAGCVGLSSGIKIMRTKDHLPTFMEGYWGPLIRTVSSVDGQETFQGITPSQYVKLAKSKNFRFNKTRYYWFLDDHLYFPNISWEVIRVEGIFRDDISAYKCIECRENSEFYCAARQDQSINIPDYLFAEMESNVIKDLMLMIQTPSDLNIDNQNPTR